MNFLKSFGLALSFLFLPAFVFAKSDFRVPHSLASGRSDFLSRGLFESCFSLDVPGTRMGRPCNPAFLSLHQEEKLGVHAILGNNVRYIGDALQVLNYKANTSTVKRLFNQSSDAEFEGDADYYVRKNDWSFSLSPNRLTYYSLIRNRVLPYVSVYAAQEHVLRAQKSWELGQDLYVGLQARGVVRRFIFSEFFLADAVVEDGDSFLKTRYQNSLYLEPGILWAPSSTEYEPQISATVTQVGVTTHYYSYLREQPEAEIGFSIKPVFSGGAFRFGPHVSFNSRSDRWEDHIRIAGVYELNPWQLIGSFKVNQGDFGAYYNFEKFSGGLIYDIQYIENLRARDELLHTWYAQIGYEI